MKSTGVRLAMPACSSNSRQETFWWPWQVGQKHCTLPSSVMMPATRHNQYCRSAWRAQMMFVQ
eukprot:scaffold653124_cov59-Prasinocladus_malaysianus.AAC.1